MPRTKILFLSAVILCGSVLQSCFKPEEFPPEPAIGFKSFTTFGDSASLTITFTDGDGDIGLDPSDTQPPFDPDSPWYFNFLLDYQELRNGEWTTPDLLLPYRYRVPRITPTGRNKALKGEISVALKPWPITPDTIQVRFKVRLVDRSLNVSNEEVTPAIPVP